MNYQAQQTIKNDGRKTFVFECTYFDNNGNTNSSKKFIKEFMSSDSVALNQRGVSETRKLDLVSNA